MNKTADSPRLSPGLIFLLAASAGVIAANLYYAQPLVAMISHSLGLSPAAAGLVVTFTQIGYGMGVLFVVPLGDMIETRRLVMAQIAVAVAGLLGLAFTTHIVPYFFAAFAMGLGASTTQVIVPYAAHFATEKNRGHVVGNLMSGLMIGIMLSRPTASFLTDLYSWHAIFVLSAAMMSILGVTLYLKLPPKQPSQRALRYVPLIRSMGRLFLETPILRRRAIYQAFLFGSFCLFWTASPLYLADQAAFGFSQTGIAFFALAGVAGAVIAPFAGKAADRGWTRPATALAMAGSALAYFLGHLLQPGSTLALIALCFTAILIDAGTIANLVLGQRAIFSLKPEYHSRLNGLYVATIFIGGAAGSTLGAWAYTRGGWTLASEVGFSLAAAPLFYFMTEKKFMTEKNPA